MPGAAPDSQPQTTSEAGSVGCSLCRAQHYLFLQAKAVLKNQKVASPQLQQGQLAGGGSPPLSIRCLLLTEVQTPQGPASCCSRVSWQLMCMLAENIIEVRLWHSELAAVSSAALYVSVGCSTADPAPSQGKQRGWTSPWPVVGTQSSLAQPLLSFVE